MSKTTSGPRTLVGGCLALLLAGCSGASANDLFVGGGGASNGQGTGGATQSASSSGGPGQGTGGASGSGDHAGTGGGSAGHGTDGASQGGKGGSDAEAGRLGNDDASIADGPSANDVASGAGDGSLDAFSNVDVTRPPADGSNDAFVAHDAGVDAFLDAPISVDACIPTNGGVEVCDGLDNNCNRGVDEGAVCPTGCMGATHRGDGYMLCTGQDVRKSWNAAQASCAERGMHLARIDDAEQNGWIHDLATNAGGPSRLWIGASEPNDVGTWVWTDGTQFWKGQANGMSVAGHYANWEAGQPDRATSGEDCATMRDAGAWGDDTCSNTNPYICLR